MLEHDYDGIRELDNVLPPWWVWLFYGCIAWGVFYLAAVHVLDILPEQTTEYKEAMAQAEMTLQHINRPRPLQWMRPMWK
ncbi:MAG: hypothetical protein IPI91_05830 [Flavobacteriales bacterium]|nr:hypothetical protein [Flavobacteriales bacterium]